MIETSNQNPTEKKSITRGGFLLPVFLILISVSSLSWEPVDNAKMVNGHREVRKESTGVDTIKIRDTVQLNMLQHT